MIAGEKLEGFHGKVSPQEMRYGVMAYIPPRLKELHALNIWCLLWASSVPTDGKTWRLSILSLDYLSDVKRITVERVSIPFLSETGVQLKNLKKLSLFMCNVDEVLKNSTVQGSQVTPNFGNMNMDYCDMVKITPGWHLINAVKADILREQRESGLVHKQYIAKVVGEFPEYELVVDANVDYNVREGRSTAEIHVHLQKPMRRVILCCRVTALQKAEIISQVFANEINIAVEITEQNYTNYTLRKALKTDFYDLQAARDEYRFSCGVGGYNRDLVMQSHLGMILSEILLH
ncbi:hypothetical protein VNO78_12276 [Psophocarpus tetragonolobus]|uniref:Uncharacterized protein n=1 Tax=Psophocarpus tetragonolobus TaxID=3891 RepID=A0AAN9SPK9_PSOTE